LKQIFDSVIERALFGVLRAEPAAFLEAVLDLQRILRFVSLLHGILFAPVSSLWTVSLLNCSLSLFLFPSNMLSATSRRASLDEFTTGLIANIQHFRRCRLLIPDWLLSGCAWIRR
jgi:hypothetical protein